MSKKKKSTVAKANPLKVILPVICGLLVVVAVAIVITVVTAPAKSAKVSNPNSAYVKIGDYKITKQEMYEALKSGSGLTTLQEMVDKELILNNVEYTADEYEEAKGYILYGDDDDYKDLSDEEKEEKRNKAKEDYLTSLQLMGYMSEAERDAYVDLQVKRYLYTMKAYLADSTDTKVSDDELKTLFKGDDKSYEDSFMGLIITFENEDQLKNYLDLVGVDGANYKTAWNRLADVEANKNVNAEIKELQDANSALEDEIAELEASLEEATAAEDQDEIDRINGEITEKRGTIETNQNTIGEKEAQLISAEDMKLSKQEIQLAYIKLYNLVNAYYNGATDQFDADGVKADAALIKEGTHYEITPDGLEFNLEALAELEENNKFVKFTFTKSEADTMDGATSSTTEGLSHIMFEHLKTLEEVEAEEAESEEEHVLAYAYTTTMQSMTNGLKFLAYKLVGTKAAEIDEEAFEAAKPALRDQFLRDVFDEGIETKYLIKVRQEHELKLYDRYLNASYKAAYVYLFEKTLEEENYPEYTSDGGKSKKLAFSFKSGDKTIEYTADEFFEALVKHYGAQALTPKMNSYALLTNHDYNVVYDPYAKKVLDKEAYNNVVNGFNIYNLYYYGQLTTVKEFKYAFENDVFDTYGFDSKYGWSNFLKDYMLLQNDRFLVGSLVLSQANTYFNLANLKTEDLQAEMQKIYDDYYSMKVVNMLITVDYDNDNNPDKVNLEGEQEFWSADQIALAQELTSKIHELRDELAGESDTTMEAKLKAVVEAYNKATVLDETWGKYHQAGLKAKVESAADYTSSSSLVAEFHTEMAKVYRAIEADQGLGTEDSESGLYFGEATFPTVYGYHRVLITKTNDRTYLDDNKGHDFSTLTVELYKQHLSDSKQLTDAQNTAIETYLEPAIEKLSTDSFNGLLKSDVRAKLVEKMSFADEALKTNLATYEGLYKEYLTKQAEEE